jgi:DNA invertase Pin-like site-specific DNA recombinase
MNTQAPRAAYNYIRFSSAEQAQGDSYRRQSVDAAKWASINGYRIVETLQDRGVSAFKGDNAEHGSLAGFVRGVDEGKIPQGTVLIVEDLDRLSREAPWIALGRFFNLIGKGIGIVNLIDNQVYTADSLNNDATGSTLFGPIVNMARGHNESVQKRNRGGKNWTRKREQARLRPGAPDSILTSLAPGWLKVKIDRRKQRHFIVDNDKADIVRRIFAETVQGFGRRMIAKRLNRDGKDAFRSKHWQPSSVQKILRGKAVLGIFQPHVRPRKNRRIPDGDPIVGYFPQIIDESLWHAANAKITERRHKTRGRPSATMPNLIPGFARCSCGQRMVFLNKGQPPKGGRYYVCGAAVRSADCNNGRLWSAELVERVLLYQIDPKPILLIGTLVEPDAGGPSPKDLDVQIEEIKRRRGKLIKAFAKGDEEIDEQTKAEIDALLAEIKTLRKKRDEAEAAAHVPAPFVAVRTALGELADLTRRLNMASDDERTELRYAISERLRAVFHEIEFKPHELVGLIPLPGKPARIERPVGLAGVPRPITTRKIEGEDKYFLRHNFFSDDPDTMALMGDVGEPSPKGIFNSRYTGS